MIQNLRKLNRQTKISDEIYELEQSGNKYKALKHEVSASEREIEMLKAQIEARSRERHQVCYFCVLLSLYSSTVAGRHTCTCGK